MDNLPCTNKKNSLMKTLRKISGTKGTKRNGKQDYIKTNVSLATEKQAKEDDEFNRKIYAQKMELYHQIIKMIENSDVNIDFTLSNKPESPPSPDNHNRWLSYQQAMTPQPAWMMVQATTYLINKGYRPQIDFNVEKTIEFCRQMISQNNDYDILEYKEENIPPQPSRIQSLYNFEPPLMENKSIIENTYRRSISSKSIPSAPVY